MANPLKKTRPTVKGILYRFLHSKKNSPETFRIGKLYPVPGCEEEKKILGVKDLYIHPKNYHLICNPVSTLEEEYYAELPSGFFHGSVYTTLARITRTENEKVSYRKMLFRKLKKKMGNDLWNEFLSTLSAEKILLAKKMLFSIMDKTSPVEKDRDDVFSILKTYKLKEIYRQEPVRVWSNLEDLFVIVNPSWISVYSWEGYYDLKMPMKLILNCGQIQAPSVLLEFFLHRNIPVRKKITYPQKKKKSQNIFSMVEEIRNF